MSFFFPPTLYRKFPVLGWSAAAKYDYDYGGIYITTAIIILFP